MLSGVETKVCEVEVVGSRSTLLEDAKVGDGAGVGSTTVVVTVLVTVGATAVTFTVFVLVFSSTIVVASESADVEPPSTLTIE